MKKLLIASLVLTSFSSFASSVCTVGDVISLGYRSDDNAVGRVRMLNVKCSPAKDSMFVRLHGWPEAITEEDVLAEAIKRLVDKGYSPVQVNEKTLFLKD